MDVTEVVDFVFSGLAAGFRRPARSLAVAGALVVVGGLAGLAFHLVHGFAVDGPSVLLGLALGLGALAVGVILVGVAVRLCVHLAGVLLALAVRRG